MASRLLGDGRDPYAEIVSDLDLVRAAAISAINDPHAEPDIRIRAQANLVKSDKLYMDLTGSRAPIRIDVGTTSPPVVTTESLFSQERLLTHIFDETPSPHSQPDANPSTALPAE